MFYFQIRFGRSLLSIVTGGNFILIQIRVCLSFPEFKESKYKKRSWRKEKYEGNFRYQFKKFSLIVKIPQGSSVFFKMNLDFGYMQLKGCIKSDLLVLEIHHTRMRVKDKDHSSCLYAELFVNVKTRLVMIRYSFYRSRPAESLNQKNHGLCEQVCCFQYLLSQLKKVFSNQKQKGEKWFGGKLAWTVVSTGVTTHVGKIMVLTKYLCFSIHRTDVEKFLKISEYTFKLSPTVRKFHIVNLTAIVINQR